MDPGRPDGPDPGGSRAVAFEKDGLREVVDPIDPTSDATGTDVYLTHERSVPDGASSVGIARRCLAGGRRLGSLLGQS